MKADFLFLLECISERCSCLFCLPNVYFCDGSHNCSNFKAAEPQPWAILAGTPLCSGLAALWATNGCCLPQLQVMRASSLEGCCVSVSTLADFGIPEILFLERSFEIPPTDHKAGWILSECCWSERAAMIIILICIHSFIRSDRQTDRSSSSSWPVWSYKSLKLIFSAIKHPGCLIVN